MENKALKSIESICEADEMIGLLYLFGSRAKNTSGINSDYDFAVYFDAKSGHNISDRKLELISKISYAVGSDRVDLVVLNEPVSPELKYAVIREGELIFEREPFRVIVEPRIMNEYFDFRTTLLRYGLTKKVYVE